LRSLRKKEEPFISSRSNLSEAIGKLLEPPEHQADLV